MFGASSHWSAQEPAILRFCEFSNYRSFDPTSRQILSFRVSACWTLRAKRQDAQPIRIQSEIKRNNLSNLSIFSNWIYRFVKVDVSVEFDTARIAGDGLR